VEYLIHLANILYLLSYSVRDILWLRLLSVVAMLALIPFYYSQHLMQAIYWNLLFLAVNLVQLYRLLLERRPVQLTLEQQRLYRGPLRALRPRDFVRLLEIGRWVQFDAGTRIAEQGATLDRLTLIADGDATVEVDGVPVTRLGAGQFVGEIAYLTGKPASAAVAADPKCHCVQWSFPQLRTFLETRGDVRGVMQDVIGNDLAHKLRGTGVSIPDPIPS
jgi:hypothetical protein